MRLNRYLAGSGVASRRKSEAIVRSGRVKVDGLTITNPFHLLQPDDVVSMDDQEVSHFEERRVILLNKPKGVITTVEDTRGRVTVLDLVKQEGRLFPVGRLDKETTGALLLTNDGDLAHRLTHPRFEVEKVYVVLIDRPLGAGEAKKIESGIDIGNGETGRAKVLERGKISGDAAHVKLSLSHGKKREVRRILSRLGYRVLALHRESFAGIRAEGLDLGQWRNLNREEVARLTKRFKERIG